eukprot:SAG22_NODE_732_length_7583_cov_3.250134_6_plen_201_part_00
MAADLKPLPMEVSLRLSPTRPNRRSESQNESFTRMYQGRPSIGPVKSDSAMFLAMDFSEGTSGMHDEDDEDGGGGFSAPQYDPKEPWASPRGAVRQRKSTPPRHNFLPGLTQLAQRVRQRSIYTGDFNMTRKTQYFFEHPRSKTPPSKEQAALKLAQDLSGPTFGETKRKGIRRRPTKLPQIKATPRLSHKLNLLEEAEA